MEPVLLSAEATRLYKQYEKAARLKKGGGVFLERLTTAEKDECRIKAIKHSEMKEKRGVTRKEDFNYLVEDSESGHALPLHYLKQAKKRRSKK